MYLHKAKWHLLECCKLLYILSKHIYTASLQRISNTVGKKQTWPCRHFHVDNIMKTAREKTGWEPAALLLARCSHQTAHWKTERFSTSTAALLETANGHSTINPATGSNILDPKQLFSIFIITHTQKKNLWRLPKPFIAQIAQHGQCSDREIAVSQPDLNPEFLLCAGEKLDKLQQKKSIL